MKNIKVSIIILSLMNIFIFFNFSNSFANDENMKVKALGEYYSRLLMTSLKKELKKAIKHGGLINAISICS